MHDLLQDIWLLPSARIFIFLSKHLKQAKIVLSPHYQHTQFQLVTRKKTFEANGFDAQVPTLSPRKCGPLVAANSFLMLSYATTS